MTSVDSATAPPESGYLDHLPAIYRSTPDGKPGVLGQFLRAFEEVLSGVGNADRPGLAEVINGIAPNIAGRKALAGLHRYCEPGPGLDHRHRTPRPFLDWLSGWVALSLRADLDEQTQRQFIAKAAWLYRQRGTPQGLAAVLAIYTKLGVTIKESGEGFRVGKTATVGADTVIGGFAPHYFEVTLRRPALPQDQAAGLAKAATPEQLAAAPLPEELVRILRIATEIIEAEKPAHCIYRLNVITASFQVGVTSRIGVDTLLVPKHA